MLTRRLTLVAFAALFAASSSLAMLQSARPASADQDDHGRRIAQHQRNDHDRDDRIRHHHPKANNGRHVGWNNPRNPHYHAPAHAKKHVDPWRDRR
jgi:hypothetical protein